jgi:hypothetical protein
VPARAQRLFHDRIQNCHGSVVAQACLETHDLFSFCRWVGRRAGLSRNP